MANLGSNRIGFVNEPLYFDGSRSSSRFDLPVVTYAWSVSGSPTITTYANQSQVSISWPSPGLYTVSLAVTDRFGSSFTGTRQVMIYQDRNSALPGIITVSGLSGSLDGGGWQCQMTTVNSQTTILSPDAIPVGTYLPFVLMVETRYEVLPQIWVNRTVGADGHFNPGYPYSDARILFDGYVQAGSIHQDVDKDTLSFSCVGPQMILQETKTHLLGYYNTKVNTRNSAGQPTSLKTSSMGKGFLVHDLMTADVIHSLIQTHCNLMQFHDCYIWNAAIPTAPYLPGQNQASFNTVYSTLSVNEGTIWGNLGDLNSNEFASFYCGRDGALRVGPQINYRSSEFWQQPTLLGATAATALINFAYELGFDVGTDVSSMTGNLPLLPAQPMPVIFVNPWGPRLPPPQFGRPFQVTPDGTVASRQSQLNGPPILCTFSDIPVPDPDLTPPGALFPWISNNWPQDLAVYPTSVDIPTNYTGRAALVKMIGTLAGHTTLWSTWWPQNSFKATGDGTPTTVTTVLPAGDWRVDQSHVLPDITAKHHKNLVNHYWWEMSRRTFYANNINFNGTITLGMFTAVSLGDIVGITRQNNTLGPHWTNKPFYVTQVDYALDLTARTSTTTLTVAEVTSILMGPIAPAPYPPPKL